MPINNLGFHQQSISVPYGFQQEVDYNYTFYNHFHPYVGYLVQKLNKGEIEDLLAVETQLKSEGFFPDEYIINPGNDGEIQVNYFDKEVDFAVEGPYSIYNWELFFHIPLSIAVVLTKNQRFADAQRWFHFIFNPSTDELEDPDFPTARYWGFLPFRKGADATQITKLLENLSLPDYRDPELEKLKERLRYSIAAWRKKPFVPSNVARFRPLSYQFHVVMKYLDMLIAWGDSLFRQFTIETINEATQLYVLARNILGPRPQKVPTLKKRPIRNYRQLKNKLDEFGNALVEMENEFPLNSNIPANSGGASGASTNSLLGIAKQLYFCIPNNKKLLEYWDTVDDRLFKIRNCMDIEGNVRQLPLFQPPIDPGMLVKAAAGGMDISSLVAGLNQPVSNVKFLVLLQNAKELCNEVKALGGALLSAIEKGEAEKLTLIRQEHEIKILELTQDIKYLQWKEAEASTEALLQSRASAYQRYRHYQLLLGKEEGDFSAPEALPLQRPELSEENFEDVYASLVEGYGQELDLEEYREEKLGLVGEAASSVSNSNGLANLLSEDESSAHLQLNKMEEVELNVFMPSSTSLSLKAGDVGAISTLLSLIPQFAADGKPMGVGAGATFGGRQLSTAVSFVSQLLRLDSEILSFYGNRASKLGSYKRRIDDWVLQNNLASKELQQIGKQLIASLIREQSLKKGYENHKVQIEQSRSVEEFLKDKFTKEDLYLWMQSEISKLYYDYYKLAFDTAKKAEMTMKYELMRKELDGQDFIKFNYWDAGRKGLLSGEGLLLDIKRMELSYLESNKREFEMTKHISLNQLDPVALLELKTYGSCEIMLPEWLFDLDCPGHYMRRIKNVSLSIPGIVGPYTSVNCTLSLDRSVIRVSPLLLDGEYGRSPDEDTRFRDYYGAVQSIVTSNAQNDSGMFEVNFRDERFLPFEGNGVISRWQLSLQPDENLRQFDYNSISDVILHMRYTARQGGEQLQGEANDSLKTKIEDANTSGLMRMFSLKHDFPDQWHKFLTSSDPFETTIKKEHFPYFVRGIEVSLNKLELYNGKFEKIIPAGIDQSALETLSDGINNNNQGQLSIPIDAAILKREDKAVVFMVIHYSVAI